MIFRKLGLQALFAVLINGQQQNITYSTIASPASADMSVAVLVDNVVFPLFATGTNSLLYQGEAPIASSGYHYVILDNAKQINASEPFTRLPIQTNTLNEFFNRLLNTHQLATLPQVYDPLPSINRIKSDLHTQGQIPTLHIWGNVTAEAELHGNQLEDLDVELNLTYYGLDNVQTFENVKVSLAGRSSRYIPKLSYGLKMKTKGTDNLFGYKKLKLRALGMDPTYVREYISYSTLKAVGLPVSGFSYIRLFVNKKPAGLYGIIETFQDPWLASEFANGDENYKSGYLYQGQTQGANQSVLSVYSDLKYYENTTLYSLGQYKVKAGESEKENKPENFAQLQEFTKFINTSTKDTTVEEWEKRLDTEGYIRALSVENLLGFSDSYMTLADNYYLYSDPKSSRMTYIPSDLDTSLGIALFDLELILSGNYSLYPGFTIRPLTNKLFANEIMLDAFQKKLLNLAQTLVNPTIMNPFIDSVINMIYPDIEWDFTLPGFGQFEIPPLGNVRIGDLPSFFPDGFRTNWTEVPQNFNSSLNGPTGSTTMESVRGFIQKKNAAILAFYNQSNK